MSWGRAKPTPPWPMSQLRMPFRSRGRDIFAVLFFCLLGFSILYSFCHTVRRDRCIQYIPQFCCGGFPAPLTAPLLCTFYCT